MLKKSSLLFPFIICIIAAFTHGVGYALSLMTKDLKNNLLLLQTDVALSFVFATSIGSALFSPFNSLLLKKKGSAFTAATAAIFAPTGMLILYLVYTKVIPNYYPLICIAFLFWGIAASQAFLVALQAVVTFTAAEYRGLSLGIMYGVIGSSALILSLIFTYALHGNTEYFIVMISILAIVSYSSLTLFVRPLTAEEADPLAFEVDSEGRATHYSALVASVLPSVLATDEISNRYRSDIERSLKYGGNPRLAMASFRSSMASAGKCANPTRAISMFEENSSTRGRASSLSINLNDNLLDAPRNSVSIRSGGYLTEDMDMKDDEFPQEPLWKRIKFNLTRADYLLIAWLQFMCIPLGQTVIGNVTSIAEAAYRHLSSLDPEKLPRKDMESATSMAVALLSVGNFSGRMLMGVLADFSRNRFNATRSIWIVMALFCTSLALLALGFGYEQFVSYFVGYKDNLVTHSDPWSVIYFLYGAIILCGMVYGGLITISATYLSENLPLDIFPFLITMVGVLPVATTVAGSKFYGYMYDTASKDFPIENNTPTCASAECFAPCFRVLLILMACGGIPASIALYILESRKMTREMEMLEDDDGFMQSNSKILSLDSSRNVEFVSEMDKAHPRGSSKVH